MVRHQAVLACEFWCNLEILSHVSCQNHFKASEGVVGASPFQGSVAFTKSGYLDLIV